MGSVYLAHQAGLDRLVAVKVLLPEYVRSTRESERFRREALATAKLRHPNVVTVFDFGVTAEGRAYLVMEHLGGPTLDRWLASNGPCDFATAAEIIRPICLAIDASHRAGIVHRDLKPSNIVLPDPTRPDDVLRVLDFGIARLRDFADDSDLTGARMLGTPAYMAPEQIEASRADARSDIYSLGVIAYEVLTGERPFRGPSGHALLLKHIAEAPPPPSEIRLDLPPAVDATLLSALAKDPAKRFATAREFADALTRALVGTSADDQIRQLRSVAERDELTGLYNRRAFYARLAQAKGRADREGESFVAAIIDVDDFKRVNDSLGHLAGDDALKRVAEAIRSIAGQDDVACRYAGDEFAVILYRADAEGARAELERVCAAVRDDLTLRAKYGVSVSVGATLYDGTGAAPEVIVGTADRALYLMKRSGKGGVRFATLTGTGAITFDDVAPTSLDSRKTDVTTVDRPGELRFGRFFGRERELAALRDAIDSVRDGASGATLVVGEAGLGKSALAEQALAHFPDAAILRARYVEGGFAPPYSPFVEPLAAYVSTRAASLANDVTTSFEARALDAVAKGDAAAFVDAVGSAATDADRYRAFEALRTAYRRLASRDLVVLFLEDLQWADSLSLDLLAYLVGSAGDARLFVLATARADALVEGAPLRPWARGLARTGRFARIELGPLRESDVRAVVESIGGRDDRPVAVSDELVKRLTRETDGNPLYLTELLRLWASDGTLAFDPKTAEWRVGTVSDIALPPSVAELYEARLSQIDPRVVEALRPAAVLGTEFALDVLAEIDGRTEDELLDLLEEAVRAGLVVEVAGRREDTFRFAHAAVRRVLESALTAARRRRLHARIAATLDARRSAGASVPGADLARHFMQARMPERAAVVALEAAEDAWRSWALDQTEAALLVVEDARDEGASLPSEVVARSLVLRAETAATRGRAADAAASFVGALERVDASDVELLTRTLAGLGRALSEAGSGERARERLSEALRLADVSGLPAARLRFALGHTYDATGEFERALEWNAAGLDVARKSGDRATELLGTIERGQTLCRMGRYAESLEAGTTATALATAIGDRKRAWQAQNLLGIVYHEQADGERAYEHFVAACDIARSIGDLAGEVRALSNVGETHRRAGRFDEAIACYEQILAAAPDAGPRIHEGLAVNLALAYAGLGDAASARLHVDEALALNATTGDAFAAGYIAYAAAEAALVADQPQIAEGETARAIELARKVGSPEIEWQALWAAARVARARENVDAERERLRACVAIIERVAADLPTDADRERFRADKREVFAALAALGG